MPRKKNLPARTNPPADDEIELTPELAQAPAHGRKVTVERRIYSAPLEPDEIPQVDSTDDAEDGPGFDYGMAVEPAVNELLDFFDESAGDDQHMLRVWQLTQPVRGLHFKAGGLVYRGEIPYSSSFLQEVQQQYGGGVFRLQVVGTVENPVTGRRQYKILKQRTLTISAPLAPVMPDQSQPQASPAFNQPNIPYVLNAPPADQGPPPTVKENLQEVVAIVSMIDKLRGNSGGAPEAQAPIDPEVAAMTLIAKNPEVMEKVGTGLARMVLGDKAVSDENPWAEVAKDLIKSGQGPELLRVVIQEFLAPFRAWFGPPQANGQPQGPGQLPQAPQAEQPQNQPMQPMPDPQAQTSQVVMPEDHALGLMIFDCQRQTLATVAADRLIGYADKINDEAPQYSIDGYIEAFLAMTPAQTIEFVKTRPGGEAVANLAHAPAWVEQVQNLVRIKFQEGAQ